MSQDTILVAITAFLVVVAAFKQGIDGTLIPKFMLSIYYKKRVGRVFIERSYIEWRRKNQKIPKFTLEEVKDNHVLLYEDDNPNGYNGLRERSITDFYKDYKITNKYNKSTIFSNDLDDL